RTSPFTIDFAIKIPFFGLRKIIALWLICGEAGNLYLVFDAPFLTSLGHPVHKGAQAPSPNPAEMRQKCGANHNHSH
ncbi:MAG: hypothetical protein EB121_07485, partial [Alphaproteobacteria bacterium]|nr:hypothetical protein [Alphaproteobacteria bacterium]